MKPRRWYSSPEVNPTPFPSLVQPGLHQIYLHYACKIRMYHGPVLKQRKIVQRSRTVRRHAKRLCLAA